MGGSYSRPVQGNIVAGAVTVNIPLNRHANRTHLQVVLTGANTFSVDSTQDSIHWDQAVLDSAVNLQPPNSIRADPSTAIWEEEQASGTVDLSLKLNAPVAALRIVKTVGAGTAVYRIQQS